MLLWNVLSYFPAAQGSRSGKLQSRRPPVPLALLGVLGRVGVQTTVVWAIVSTVVHLVIHEGNLILGGRRSVLKQEGETKGNKKDYASVSWGFSVCGYFLCSHKPKNPIPEFYVLYKNLRFSICCSYAIFFKFKIVFEMYYICIHRSYSGTSSVLDNRVTMELISLEGEVAF